MIVKVTSQDIEGNSNKKHVRESDGSSFSSFLLLFTKSKILLYLFIDDQVEILEISDTNNTNEDFCSTLKNDKKRVKIGNTSICKKVTKPDKESLLAISKIGDPIIDSLFYSLSKLKKTGVKSVAMNLVNNSIRFITLD
ncbi:hypothetical protein GLOIN_2v1848653 [Rhizophagus irregularis DAOM 181602=DAOM 197198]|uniref:Uncharacterized protein n=1 Tax=Rhizophagus irregularis (strain DAOM 181602 / DAOM 197198 / MUCL 43194) TaxID=747089 RepID=A0A2P4NZU3_RHIID|nr:hypothetical protein GLOIN_2v1848653 [Rhizophagus irregularis DAOM 181602=DAOM 197198]POG58652.1 hypothetical protein GLOIN_2v1848653 [Rhizophagus irregularis DAOM 181602=DAOM 197198]|eukprot:XP_025165518.1 hypothetical protein GLOIN_2v1848653 [Rhizophagus irregularis DAOM 181602=DAOM 197198]